jgi:CRISPR-associated protein Cmr2
MPYFHFTIGPVQGFVSQARRTRDFWAGSFILSWLSAVAMRAVQRQGGMIIFPKPDDAFMAALETGDTELKQGNVPNRFKASVLKSFAPDDIVMAVRQAWTELAEWVFECDLKDIRSAKTREIWERQIKNFWEISWALTDDPKDSIIIDRLKNWRTYLPPDEPGVKCMMMEGWQELSGVSTPHGEALQKFWNTVREVRSEGMKTDLREGEHLCAIAFVKRRFARHFATFTSNMPGDWKLTGWKLPSGVPSVHYMAAAPWLAELIKKANSDKALSDKMWTFHKVACQLTGHGELKSNIRCVREAMRSKSQKFWAALDGTVFFEAMLENQNLWDTARERLVLNVLGKLKEVRDAAQLEPVSPFYAVLLMDGDQLGMHMSEPEKQNPITEGLARFTDEAQTIVDDHSGFLIYAGGDDILALLPLEEALACAAALRALYMRCFDLSKILTSLSGAIEYAHIKMPLGKVLRDAHDLLDNVAKEGRGRDAIACRVWKPGGLAVEWAMPWDCALDSENKVKLDRLADEFRPPTEERSGQIQVPGLSGDEEDRFATKFFFKIRQRFDLLNPKECSYLTAEKLAHATGKHKPVLDPEQAISLMAAEYLTSGAARVKKPDEACGIIRPLLEQCRPVIRDQTKAQGEWKMATCLSADGALLVRFLAKKGVER